MPFKPIPVEWNGKKFESLYAMAREYKMYYETLYMCFYQKRKFKGHLIKRPYRWDV